MIQLLKLRKENLSLLTEMMEDWTNSIEKIIPYAIRKADYHDFESYLTAVNDSPGETIPNSTYFAYDVERDIFVGAINIRHHLDEKLILDGGHIGVGVKPSERRRGYGLEMLRQALSICRALGLKRILITCDKTNRASAQTIMKAGGVLENEIYVDGEIVQRYWIDI